MKMRLLILTIAICLTPSVFGQFSFGVSPGLSLNGAYFGYKFNRIVPFVGIQYFGGSMNFRYTYEDFNYDTYEMELHQEEASGKINLLVPNVGVKYFFLEKGSLKAHLTLNISKPIISGKFEYNGESDEFFDDFADGLSIWGGELSFGTEYFFDEHFSLGGEFGMRYLHVSNELNSETTIFNPATGEYQPSQELLTTKFTGKPTFSRVSLNYYF